MSNISTIVNQLRNTTIPTITGFTDRTQIPNPYSLGDNAEIFLEAGWGLKILDSNQITGNFCEHWEKRFMSVILTERLVSIGNNNEPLDTEDLVLMEAVVELRKTLLNPDQFGVESSLEKVDFPSNSGIQFLRTEKNNYLFTETVFSFDISEEVN